MNVLARLTRQAIGGLFFALVLMVFLNEPAPGAFFVDAETAPDAATAHASRDFPSPAP